jgi:hypothetical protein
VMKRGSTKGAIIVSYDYLDYFETLACLCNYLKIR